MNYLQKLMYVPVKFATRARNVSPYRLMTLFVIYKSVSLYQSTRKERKIAYKEVCEDGAQNTILIESGVFNEHFHPSHLLLSGIVQTLYAGLVQLQAPNYVRETIPLPDGGQITLQTLMNKTSNKGIIAIVPGVCGEGKDAYVINSVKKAVENGYSAIVINHRGLSDTKLLTPITHHGGSWFDTKAAIDYIHAKYPNQPIYGIGFSMGSNILGRYLGETGPQSKLSGAICICCPFDTLESSTYCEKSCFGIISRYLAYNIKNKVLESKEILPLLKEAHGIDFEEILKSCKKFRDYDDKVTAKIFGYSGVVDYYTKCCIIPYLKQIKTKTLFISSLDDPFFGDDIIPYGEFTQNEDIYLVATRGGGHVGYYDNILSTDQWHNKPAFKFIDYLNTLDRYFVKA